MVRSLVLLPCTILLFPYLTLAQPWIPVSIWEKWGAGPVSGYGSNIFSLGDQNNDGYKDWGILAYGENAGQESESLVELFHGGLILSTVPYMIFRADSNVAFRVSHGDALGDLNGDGYIDWGIWMRYLSSIMTYSVEIYYGGPSSDTIPDAVLHLRVGHQSIWGMGDFNGDGFDDIYRYNDDLGEGLVYFGSAAFDTNWDWRVAGNILPNGAFGDLNGDGYADFVSGSNNANNDVAIYRGSPNPTSQPFQVVTGLPASLYMRIIEDLNGDHMSELVFPGQGSSNVHLGGDSLRSTDDFTLNFGCEEQINSCRSAGDLNHDGYGDLLVYTDYCTSATWGKLCVYLGHPWLNAVPALIIWGRGGPLNLPAIWTARGVGDINGDGVDDFAIGAVGDDADSQRGKVVIVSGDSTIHAAVDEECIPLPVAFYMSVFPNPFNASTQISFTLPVTSRVSLRLYDVLGREVKLLMDETQTAGEHRMSFDGSGLSSGVYLCRIQAGEFQQTRKIVLMK